MSGDRNEIHLYVNVPEAAQVFVNGNETKSTGSTRHFMSRNLIAGDEYRFEVKVVLADSDGIDVQKTEHLVVLAGEIEEVTFDESSFNQPVETVLTLNVPKDAVVVLGNNETKSLGESRVYRSKHLREGEAWDEYRIEVTHNGQTKSKVIRLIGGDDLALSFNFNEASSNQLASR